MLAGARSDSDVDDAGDVAQARCGLGDFFAGHVVHLEGDLRDAVAGERWLCGRLDDEGAQDVGDAGQRARAGAKALAANGAEGHRCARQHADDGGAGRCHALARNTVVKHGLAGEEYCGGGGGHGHSAVLGFDHAGPKGEWAEAEGGAGTAAEDAAGCDHIHERIPVGQFVEVNVLDGNAVDGRFCGREGVQDGVSVLDGGGGQRRVGDALAKRAVVGVAGGRRVRQGEAEA